MAAAGGGRGRETIAALAMVVVAAALVVVVTTRGAGRRRPTVLTPHPYLVPYAEFNAGPGYNHEALNYQATKAGASQEWLQYSLHHDGSLQQARASSAARVLAPARGRSARTSAAVQVRDVQAKSASDLKKGIVDTSGNFQEDDGTLFGGGTFDQSHESPGTPLPYQKEQTGGGDFDEYCEDEQGHEVPCGDDEYCLDDQGREVPCDYYCVDENGSEVSCDDDEPEAEPEPEKMAGPSDFLTSIVKAVSSGVLRYRCAHKRECVLSVACVSLAHSPSLPLPHLCNSLPLPCPPNRGDASRGERGSEEISQQRKRGKTGAQRSSEAQGGGRCRPKERQGPRKPRG